MYCIKVNNKSESTKVQDLLHDIGYYWSTGVKYYYGITAYPKQIYVGHNNKKLLIGDAKPCNECGYRHTCCQSSKTINDIKLIHLKEEDIFW